MFSPCNLLRCFLIFFFRLMQRPSFPGSAVCKHRPYENLAPGNGAMDFVRSCPASFQDTKDDSTGPNQHSFPFLEGFRTH